MLRKAGIGAAIIAGAAVLLLAFFGDTLLAIRTHLENAPEIDRVVAETRIHLAGAERVDDFVDEGERFTAKKGFKLELRVAALETESAYTNQRIADALDSFGVEIARLRQQVDRLETHNGGPGS